MRRLSYCFKGYLEIDLKETRFMDISTLHVLGYKEFSALSDEEIVEKLNSGSWVLADLPEDVANALEIECDDTWDYEVES